MSRDLSNILIKPTTTILDTIKAIDAGGLQIAMIVDAEGRLLGAVTDGDIRRGLLRGVGLDAPVDQVMNPTPHCLFADQGRAEALEMMTRLSIHQIPVIDAQRRVVRLEVYDTLLSPEDVGVSVVLMAGGLGERLRPLTELVPKPMIPVGGRPLLETIIGRFQSQGFRDIRLSVGYKAEVIQDHFGDGSAFGVNITYIHETKRLGTAGALSLLANRPAGPFIVMNGDLLTSVDFNTLVAFHREQGAMATLCVREYVFQVPYGVVYSQDAKLVEIREKPTNSFFVNAGVYVVEPAALDLLDRDQAIDMPNFLERIRAEAGEVAVFPLHEYWRDIGQIDDLEVAQDDFDRVFQS